ncbi:hypothetical protein GCM10007853_29560 [Algimonas ampicilliniresistens]|uniref:Uncharacterized protein n=1 Tax=Algimonas ampicilliniresistens TaxID=1298735 RepID=A0ABQ5VDQ8_9PROT|nr:hypothetical protein [Algimonas ampicilliniresistens]GLQ25082.1 hypothetical protein GCM10007853_29560 [Algimonas ampicilliniresistens]
MRWFRCLAHGENFVVSSEGTLKNRGFYKIIFVEASSSSDVEFLAPELLRADDFLSDDILIQRSPNASVTFEEIDELVGEPSKGKAPALLFIIVKLKMAKV